MKQVYHSNSTTNVRLRAQINKEKAPYWQLAQKYGVSENTIGKWKKRTTFEDKSSSPHTLHYALDPLEQQVVVSIRSMTWWALDEIAEIIKPQAPQTIRSAVYRTFVRECINRVPEKEKEKAKKIKEYDPGYLPIDIRGVLKIHFFPILV